jgi:hypothetical protein
VQKIFTFILFIVFSFPTLAIDRSKENYRTFTLQKGDFVSQIMLENGLDPLANNQNFLEKVLKINRLTRDSARKMRPGDVIWLPIKREVPKEKIVYRYKTIVAQKVSPIKSEHSFLISGGYFYNNYNFKTNNHKVSTKQNFQLQLDYLAPSLINLTQGFALKSSSTLKVYSQDQAEFSFDRELAADFAPSFAFEQSLNLEHKRSGVSTKLGAEYENLSILSTENGIYDVTSYEILWSKLSLRKVFLLDTRSLFTDISYSTGNAFKAKRVKAVIGMNINNYEFQAFFSETALSVKDEAALVTLGSSLGYRF